MNTNKIKREDENLLDLKKFQKESGIAHPRDGKVTEITFYTVSMETGSSSLVA